MKIDIKKIIKEEVENTLQEMKYTKKQFFEKVKSEVIKQYIEDGIDKKKAESYAQNSITRFAREVEQEYKYGTLEQAIEIVYYEG